MKRKSLLRLHISATVVAFGTISIFLLASLLAELRGEAALIQMVKRGILYALPLLLLAMPTLAVTGNQLAGRSAHPDVRKKRSTMKLILANGIALMALAGFLYYRAHYRAIDTLFLYAQLAEFFLGGCNLLLIGRNIKTGLRLSGRFTEKPAF